VADVTADEPLSRSAHGQRLAWSTAIFASLTGVSRVVGLVREIVAKRAFGVEGSINAFTVAFLVPNLVRSLVADMALSSAFVPVFSELLEKGEKVRAWRLASSLLFIFALGLTALTAIFVLLAPWLMKPFGFEGEQHDLAVGLARVMFPIVALLGVSGIVVGVLNSYERFTIAAVTPIFWNLAIIIALLIGVPIADSESSELYIYAGGVLIGTVIQVLLPVPWLMGLDGKLRVLIDWRDPAVKRFFKLMLPVTLGLGLINFNLIVDSLFAAQLIDAELAPAAIDAAFRIYMLPQGIFSVAVATVLFPALSRLAARGDMQEFTATTSAGLRQIGFMLIPASAVGAVLALPVVRLLYEGGKFGPAETTVVAAALAAFMGGLTFNGAMLMLNRAFFSLQSARLPTYVALGNLGLNAALDFAFYRFGVWGLPLATSVVNIVGAFALAILLRKRLGRLDGTAIIASYVRIVIAAAVAAGVAYGVWWVLDGSFGRSTGAQAASVGLAILAAMSAYVVSASLLGIRELGTLLSLVSRSGRRSEGRDA
jgi:putative peptidoglycan lipid II flippase